MVNDGALNFSLLLLYVSIDRELVWLQEQDFQIELVIGSKKTMPGYDESDCWVHILRDEIVDGRSEDEFTSESDFINSAGSYI